MAAASHYTSSLPVTLDSINSNVLVEEKNQRNIVNFFKKEGLVLSADKIFQGNIQAPNKNFNIFKKVARSLGYGGECGTRGGYMEFAGFTCDALEEALYNLLEGVTCNRAEAATYLPKEATEVEETPKTIATDAFKRKRLLNATGYRFGQVPGTWHFRYTILPQQDKIPATSVLRVREFHKSSVNGIPKRTKFEKQHDRGRVKGIASHGNPFGRYALQTLEPAWLTSRQIEAGRRAMTRNVRRGEKIWVRIFADKPVTVRPTETRMGRGKGSTAFWVAMIKPGKILYEMGGVPENIARKAILIAASKLPIQTKFIISE